jgi:hypothetical protein
MNTLVQPKFRDHSRHLWSEFTVTDHCKLSIAFGLDSKNIRDYADKNRGPFLGSKSTHEGDDRRVRRKIA